MGAALAAIAAAAASVHFFVEHEEGSRDIREGATLSKYNSHKKKKLFLTNECFRLGDDLRVLHPGDCAPAGEPVLLPDCAAADSQADTVQQEHAALPSQVRLLNNFETFLGITISKCIQHYFCLSFLIFASKKRKRK